MELKVSLKGHEQPSLCLKVHIVFYVLAKNPMVPTNAPGITHVGSTNLITPFVLLRGSQAHFTCSREEIVQNRYQTTKRSRVGGNPL